MNARKILNARKSGHRHFPSGTVWTYRLSVWDLNLGIFPRLRCQTEASMSRPSQTESTYVQTVPDGKCLCQDFRAFIRLSCVHVQTFVRSCPDFRAFDRLSCVHQTFVRSCPDFRAFTRLSCVHVQTFVRTRLSCVHQTFVRSCPDFRAFMSRFSCVHQTFVRSPDFRGFMSRLSCVHQTFVRSCPGFRAFTKLSCVHVQNFRAFTKLFSFTYIYRKNFPVSLASNFFLKKQQV